MKYLSLVLTVVLGMGVHADQTETVVPADALWQQLQTLVRRGPAERGTTEAEQKSNFLTFLNEVETLCDRFIREFPEDSRVWEARLNRVEIRLSRGEITEKTVDLPAVSAELKIILAAPTASKPVKNQAGFMSLQLLGSSLVSAPDATRLAEFDREYEAFVAANPVDRATRSLPFLRVRVYEAHDKTKAAALLKELASHSNPAIAAEASRQLKTQEFKSKPLELKFTTVDGKEFDIAKWRGKVVLVDFWATWCGPCRREIPNVVATYKKHHGKGFEIVGVSLDSQKEKLDAYTKEYDMTWPQYFDGKGWGNTISTSFGINGIPTMWLVDKNGFVRHTEIRADLEKQVAALLAE